MEGRNLGIKIDGLVFALADENFFFRTLEDLEAPTINTYEGDDDGINLDSYDFTRDGLSKNSKPKSRDSRKISYRFRRIRDLYNNPNVLKGSKFILSFIFRPLFSFLFSSCFASLFF